MAWWCWWMMVFLQRAIHKRRPTHFGQGIGQWALDRVPKKSKFAERPAEFSVYSRGKYKNFLLTKFLKISQNARAQQQLMQ